MTHLIIIPLLLIAIGWIARRLDWKTQPYLGDEWVSLDLPKDWRTVHPEDYIDT